MRLISLSADHESFHAIRFNKSGITLVLGKKKSSAKNSPNRTYNGVGKSLSIALIDFCLGANKRKGLEEQLPDWAFTLAFEHQSLQYSVTRNTSNQNKIIFNDEEVSLAKYRERLESIMFDLLPRKKSLTGRSLISRFIRPGRASYAAFDKQQPSEKPYERLLRNGFLLGLDTELIENKRNLTVERDRTREFEKNIRKDEIFHEFFAAGKDSQIELKDLEDEIGRLQEDLSNFRVAENYEEQRDEADRLTSTIRDMKNRAAMFGNELASIEQSLREKADLAVDQVAALYAEAKTALPDAVVKRMEEVVSFHKGLVQKRSSRLSQEKQSISLQLEELRSATNFMNRELDEKLGFLGEHGALDEYSQLSDQLSLLKTKAQKIRDYQQLLASYSKKIRDCNTKLNEEAERSDAYLLQESGLMDENLERFRGFSSRFYSSKPGGLTVKNNDGDNQIRFNIEAKIEDDASDGINDIKIFCFDMTLLLGRHRHQLDFIYHDSRLFSDIDPRQRTELFRVANEFSNSNELQYIANVNEDELEAMKELMEPDEYEEIFSKNVVLELTDESDEAKLLGVQVDLTYEK